ncbi:Glycoside Hydrolase Family 16 protein [Trametes cinnabarina]|uniref:Glycoside Hydrolase Family 16 protein n=1 Tax=Pycnoporus cinnabarinus TaxID=5643 RepID=A0A060S6Q2_PYCCI|nr:Glycoside Hydrolase Family 16 protein [Trametes cinnabarina]
MPETMSTSDESSSVLGRSAPDPTFFVHHRGESTDGGSDGVRNPFSTPDRSVPPTPAPASVISFSGSGSASFSDQPMYRRHDSRISVQSAPRPMARDVREQPHGTDSGVDTSSTHHTPMRSSFMPPRALRQSTIRDPARSSLVPRAKRMMRSHMLTGAIEKPWVAEKDAKETWSYWIVYVIAFIGVAAAVIRCYFSYAQTPLIGNVCLILEDNFDTFDTQNVWMHEVSMSGFGNSEFEMTTDSPNNSFVRDGRLYIVPTLTSDVIGYNNIFNGYTYNLTGCTDGNSTNCGAVSNETLGTVIPPVMSARIHTREPYTIKYGKVEITAKLPRGDWLWPALWMLPLDDAYGPWPRSGEIDIMEARGNSQEYKAQGIDYVRGSLNWGPFTWLNGVSKTFGWWTNRRKTFADGFHTYSLEWTPEFIRIYVDSRLTYMLFHKFDEPFFDLGGFPPVVQNGSQFIETPNPWASGTKNVAPFDQPFYLIVNLAVGGTSGWFPDGVGNKPWLDGSISAMRDFAEKQDEWYATWPQTIEERALVVDSVKMWRLC